MRTLAILSLGVCCFIVATRPTAAQTPQEAGQAIVEKAIKAHGGEKVLAGIKAMHLKGKGSIETNGMKLPFDAEIFSQLPNKFKVLINLDIMGQNIEVAQCFDGKKGWQSVMGQTSDLPEEQEKDLKHQMHVERMSTLVPLREKGVKLSPTGVVKVEGKEANGLQVSTEGQQDVTLFFDKTTNLLVKAEYRAKSVDGGMEVTKEKLFSNYKKLEGGFQNPMRMVIRDDGKQVIEVDVSEVRPVERHDDSIFARP